MHEQLDLFGGAPEKIEMEIKLKVKKHTTRQFKKQEISIVFDTSEDLEEFTDILRNNHQFGLIRVGAGERVYGFGSAKDR